MEQTENTNDAIQQEKEENNLEKYVDIVKTQMLYNSKENFQELEELFNKDDFKECLREGRFFDLVRNEVGNNKLNISIVKYLIEKMENLLKEQPDNGTMQLFIKDLKKVVANHRKKIIKIVAVVLVVIWIGNLFWGWYRNSKAYVMRISPSVEEMSAIVQEEYGITVLPEDITLECQKNTHYQSNYHYPKIAVYTVSYEADGKEITFTGKRLPLRETETAFDLETSFMKFYITEYTGCKVIFTNEYGREVTVEAALTDEKSAQEFAVGFEQGVTAFFNNPAIANMDHTYYFNIDLLENLDDDEVMFELKKDTYQPMVTDLTPSLVSIVKINQINQMYANGECSEEEAMEALEKILAEME